MLAFVCLAPYFSGQGLYQPSFERFKEALGHGIIVTHPREAHALLNPITPEYLAESTGLALSTAVTMKNQS